MSTPLVPGSRRELLVGVVGMVVAGLVGWLGFAAASGAFASGYEIEVEFERTGQGLTSFSDVRIRGIGVGDVMEVTAAPDGVAVVRMRLDDGVDRGRLFAGGCVGLRGAVGGPVAVLRAVVDRLGDAHGRGGLLGGRVADLANPLVEILDGLGNVVEAVDRLASRAGRQE